MWCRSPRSCIRSASLSSSLSFPRSSQPPPPPLALPRARGCGARNQEVCRTAAAEASKGAMQARATGCAYYERAVSPGPVGCRGGAGGGLRVEFLVGGRAALEGVRDPHLPPRPTRRDPPRPAPPPPAPDGPRMHGRGRAGRLGCRVPAGQAAARAVATGRPNEEPRPRGSAAAEAGGDARAGNAPSCAYRRGP